MSRNHLSINTFNNYTGLCNHYICYHCASIDQRIFQSDSFAVWDIFRFAPGSQPAFNQAGAATKARFGQVPGQTQEASHLCCRRKALAKRDGMGHCPWNCFTSFWCSTYRGMIFFAQAPQPKVLFVHLPSFWNQVIHRFFSTKYVFFKQRNQPNESFGLGCSSTICF